MATQQLTRRQLVDEIIDNSKVAAAAAIASTKLATWSADRNAGSFKLTSLAPGTAGTDAVNLDQLNAAISASAAGLAVKEQCRAASTADVGTTYNSTGGASARGQHTGCPDTLDGVSLAANDRILLKNQTPGDENGIYVVTTLGSGSNGVWDRAEDFDEDDEVRGSVFVFVQEGTTNGDTQWVVTTDDDITIGGASGTALTWSQFGAGQTYTADEVTLTLSTNQFSIKNGGVGTTQLAADAVDGTKIADDSIDSEHYVDGSIDTVHIAADAITGALIADDQIDSEHYVAGSIDGEHIANDAIDSQHYAAGSIDNEHLAADSVDSDNYVDGSVDNVHLAGDIRGGKLAFINQTVTGTPNDVLVNFTLSAEPTATSFLVFINGIRQRPTTDYTFSGTTLTFTTAPETGDSISVFGIQA